MLVRYEIHDIDGINFHFKQDLNPVNNQYEPHIWIRHLIEPEQAIVAYLNISTQSFNKQYKRFEAYSEIDELHVWYNFIKKNPNRVLIITAFKI